MIKYICDGCGEETKDNKDFYVLALNNKGFMLNHYNFNHGEPKALHFCNHKCMYKWSKRKVEKDKITNQRKKGVSK